MKQMNLRRILKPRPELPASVTATTKKNRKCNKFLEPEETEPPAVVSPVKEGSDHQLLEVLKGIQDHLEKLETSPIRRPREEVPSEGAL